MWMNFNLLKHNMSELQETNILTRIAFSVYLLLVIDCSISSSGRWLMFGPVSIRMILGLLAIGCSVPLIFKNLKDLLRNPMIISLALFVIYLLASGVYGHKVGNRIDVINADLKGFAWLFLIPLGIVLIDRKEKVILLMKVLVLSSIIQSLLIIILNITLVFLDRNPISFMKYFQEVQIGSISRVGEDLFRIHVGSSKYVIAGCAFMFYFQMYRNKMNWIAVIGSSICFFSILISYTRSLYGATLLSLLILLIGYFINFQKMRKRLFLFVASSLIVTILLVSFFQTTPFNNYLIFGLKRTFPNTSFYALQNNLSKISPYKYESTIIDKDESAIIDKDESISMYLYITGISDGIRNVTIDELLKMIKQSFLFGNGLGASIPSRSSGLVEYTYHDLLNKVGLIGLLLYLFPVLFMLYNLISTFKLSNCIWVIKFTWFCGFFAFLFASYYNPLINNSLGICFYGLTIAVFVSLNPRNCVGEFK